MQHPKTNDQIQLTSTKFAKSFSSLRILIVLICTLLLTATIYYWKTSKVDISKIDLVRDYNKTDGHLLLSKDGSDKNIVNDVQASRPSLPSDPLIISYNVLEKAEQEGDKAILKEDPIVRENVNHIYYLSIFHDLTLKLFLGHDINDTLKIFQKLNLPKNILKLLAELKNFNDTAQIVPVEVENNNFNLSFLNKFIIIYKKSSNTKSFKTKEKRILEIIKMLSKYFYSDEFYNLVT